MPTSVLEIWPTILNMVWQLQPNSILDVGPGHGKAGLLIREYVGKPDSLDAVEAWPGYVTPIMRQIYDIVMTADVCDLHDVVLARYDLVLMIDVIEHIEKDKALELLSRIPGRVIICTPQEFFDNPPELPPTERHVSHWRVEDFGSRVEKNNSQLGALLVQLAPIPSR